MNSISSPVARAQALRTAELRSLGSKAVDHLGEGWSVDQDSRFDGYAGAYLNGPDGVRLYLSVDFRDPAYLKIIGCYPSEYTSFHPDDHSIRVGRIRGPLALAREIIRRLLPIYLPDLATAQKHERQAAEAFRVRVEAAEQIHAALPGVPRIDLDPKRHTSPRIDLPHGQITGYIAFHYHGDSELQLRDVPTPTVLRILELIRDQQTA